MRLRHSPAGVPREAAPDTQLGLEAARLYIITPERDPSQLLDYAAAVLRGGADILQLRHKTLPRGQLLDLARKLRGLAGAAGALFIVNDHVDLALLSGADGVHLGPDDLSIEAARRIAGARLLIGASASTAEAARAAIAAGANYIGCGATFGTPVKPDKAVIGPAGVATVAGAVKAPVFAIGGIEESNVGQLTSLGLHRICVIRATADSPDPEAAARRLRAMLEA